MFARISLGYLWLLAALFLPLGAQAQGNMPPGGYAGYELRNDADQALTFETFDWRRNEWHVHTIQAHENRPVGWHSASGIGRIRISTSGRGYVEYQVHAGARYTMRWSNREGRWDLRERG